MKLAVRRNHCRGLCPWAKITVKWRGDEQPALVLVDGDFELGETQC
jgi:hypothetical protein